jgi:hypothetical protein
MRYFSNISVAALGIAEDYLKINEYNWQRAKIAGTGGTAFLIRIMTPCSLTN